MMRRKNRENGENMRKKGLFKKIGMRICAIAIGVALTFGGIVPISQPITVCAEELDEEDNIVDDNIEDEVEDIVDDTELDDVEIEEDVKDTSDDEELNNKDDATDELADEQSEDEGVLEEGPVEMTMFSLVDSTDSDDSDNLFTDGDLGDNADDDLWSTWSFTASDDSVWGNASYDKWASTETTSDDSVTKGVGIYFNADGSMTMSQRIASLEAGAYEVTGYVKDTNSKSGNVQGYYGENTTDDILTDGITSSFQKFSYSFTLTEAQTDYQVGVTVTTKAGAWVCLDTLCLQKKTATSEEKQKLTALETLNTLILACKALEAEKDDYTEESYTVLVNEITTAEELYSAASVDLRLTTVDEINAATTALQTALDSLIPSTEASVFVDKINLKENFIKGVDISSFVSEKDSGVTYYDFDGEEVSDQGFFDLLADAGINWVRIRVWNNPYDASGNGYGGGNNDIEKAKEMGKLATNAGLKVLIDFHYSDFWADPAKQDAPRAWSSMGIDEKESAVYDFTYDSLAALDSAGVDVRMVQVGNETNNGICGESTSNWSSVARIYNAGSKAVRDFEKEVHGTEDGSNVRVALHFTEPNTGIQASIASNLDSYSVEYDVFATSYYPFWHGTLSNLKSVLSNIAETYGKQVMVAETSYAYTFEDGDGHENNVRADQADSLALDYNISMQGQADAVSSVIETINDTTGGVGMFYWEPAWIPVQKYDADASDAASILASNKEKWEKYGSGWAASYADEYDPEDAGRYYGGSSWDNQALFDHDGHPMDSLNVFKYVDSGTTAAVKADVARSASAEFEYGQEIVLPSTVTVVYNDGSTKDVAVIWNAEQVAAIQGYGEYTISGVAEGLSTVCNVEVFPKNLLINGGFEDGIEDGNGWTITCSENEASMLKLDSKDIKRGSNALKFDAWSATLTDAVISQTVSGLEAGTYACYMNVEGAGATDSYTVSISATGDKEAGTSHAELAGWMVWSKPQVDNIVVKDGDSITVTISITTTALETWGTIDEVYLYLVETAEEEKADDSTTEPDNIINIEKDSPAKKIKKDNHIDNKKPSNTTMIHKPIDVEKPVGGAEQPHNNIGQIAGVTREELKNEKVQIADTKTPLAEGDDIIKASERNGDVVDVTEEEIPLASGEMTTNNVVKICVVVIAAGGILLAGIWLFMRKKVLIK